MMLDAVAIMAERKISELPVVDAAGKPRGLIDITDVVGLFPEAAWAALGEPAACGVGPIRPRHEPQTATPPRNLRRGNAHETRTTLPAISN